MRSGALVSDNMARAQGVRLRAVIRLNLNNASGDTERVSPLLPPVKFKLLFFMETLFEPPYLL